MTDDGCQGASMADADDLPRIALQHGVQKVRARKGQRLHRKPELAERGSDLRHFEVEAFLERLLEVQAFRDRTIDENADQPITASARDQAMRLDWRDVQPRRDLALGQAAGVMEPRSTRGKTNLVVKQGRRHPVAAHKLRPVIFFSPDKI